VTNRETKAPELLRAAYVRRVHGIHGEVRTEACGGDWRRFTPGLRLVVEDDDTRTVTVRSARDGGDGSVLLAFVEITTEAEAETLRGRYLDVDAASARPLGPQEWFTWQLTGLRVFSPQGAELGVVEDVESSVSNDILVLRTSSGVRRYPMVHAFVKAVDLDAGVLTLEPQDEVQA
jgi:16S rRNA processing protein RimM